jgi:hypothetical protein
VGDLGQMLARGIEDFRRQGIDGHHLTAKDERALLQAALDLRLELAAELPGAVGLRVAVFANFLVGVAAVAVGDLLAAMDIGGEVVHLRRGAAGQVDGERAVLWRDSSVSRVRVLSMSFGSTSSTMVWIGLRSPAREAGTLPADCDCALRPVCTA